MSWQQPYFLERRSWWYQIIQVIENIYQ